jgi:hypothetical protein
MGVLEMNQRSIGETRREREQESRGMNIYSRVLPQKKESSSCNCMWFVGVRGSTREADSGFAPTPMFTVDRWSSSSKWRSIRNMPVYLTW